MIYQRLLDYGEIDLTPKGFREWAEYKECLKSRAERKKRKGINYYMDNRIWNKDAR